MIATSLGTGQKPPFTTIRRRPLVQSETFCCECSQRRKRCPIFQSLGVPGLETAIPLPVPVLLDIMTWNRKQ